MTEHQRGQILDYESTLMGMIIFAISVKTYQCEQDRPSLQWPAWTNKETQPTKLSEPAKGIDIGIDIDKYYKTIQGSQINLINFVPENNNI